MQTLSHQPDDSRTSLGQRRGISDLARFALDLTGARADSESTARLGSYPSPPMSGSPPLPPKVSQEAGGRSQAAYQTTTHDVYHGIVTTQSGDRTQTGVPGPPPPFQPDTADRMPYSYPRPEAPIPRPLSYHQHASAVPQPSYLPGPGTGTAPGPLPAPQAYPAITHHSIQESSHQTSPKTQRKTKGHVASACVPCKRAHLRCDAQRPCSRCLSNGKEDACVDVQHKKRGRPRLRDDRETKFDNSRFGTAQDTMRRPMSSMYPPSSSIGVPFDDGLRRTQSYRVLKSHSTDSVVPRFPERAAASDANIYPAPLSISTRIPESAAYLTVELEFAKASGPFLDAIGRPAVNGIKLSDLVSIADREKASNLQRQIQDEQVRKDPTYLPPIFGKQEEERVMRTLGFSPEELGKYALDWQEAFTFMGQDGQPRHVAFRLGLAKQDSIYFVVLVLKPGSRFQYLTPSPNPREITYSYQPIQQSFSQHTPVSATFDPRQHRDTGYGPRQIAPAGPLQGGMLTGLSPGLPSYTASSNRPDYSAGAPPYQIPRSELHPSSRGGQAPGYQLPPIRSQQPGAPLLQEPQQYNIREERSRVDIGGLLDHPDSSKPAQQ